MPSLLIVQLLMTCMYKRGRADDCGKNGLFPGIAKDRGVLSKGKILHLNTKVPSTCDAGVVCANSCTEDSAKWNFIEFRRVSMNFACPDLSGGWQRDHMYVLHNLENAIHPNLMVDVSWIHC